MKVHPKYSALATRARSSLLANFVATATGPLLAAGAHQFKTLWTRDFCLSVPGLLVAEQGDLVRRQLTLLYSFQRADLLLPRGLDVVPPQFRVLLHTALRFLPLSWTDIDYGHKKIKPEYLGEHRTPAIDSNALVVLASLQYVEATGDVQWWLQIQNQALRSLDFYQTWMKQGFVQQPPFSDWQDSTRRAGAGLYLHTLLARVHRALRRRNVEIAWLAELEERTGPHFFSSKHGVFVQDLARQQVPLEANLWILQEGLFTDVIPTAELYANLKKLPLWQQTGLPVWPESPPSEVSWTTKAVGLRYYHDGFLWSWLMAEAARTAVLMKDSAEADRIFTELERITSGEDAVAEIYDKSGAMFSRLSYRSECPFSWGAAKILEALG